MHLHKTFPSQTLSTLPSRILQFNEIGGDTVDAVEQAVSLLTQKILPVLQQHPKFPGDVTTDEITLRVEEPNLRVIWQRIILTEKVSPISSESPDDAQDEDSSHEEGLESPDGTQDEDSSHEVTYQREEFIHEEYFTLEELGLTPADLQILQIAQELEGNQSLADELEGEEVAPEVAAARAAARLEIVLSMLSAEGRARLKELLPKSSPKPMAKGEGKGKGEEKEEGKKEKFKKKKK